MTGRSGKVLWVQTSRYRVSGMGSREEFEALLNAPPVPLLSEDQPPDPKALLAVIEEISSEIAESRESGVPAGGPSRQHVVSRCVLKNFTGTTAEGVKLASVDLDNVSRDGYSPSLNAIKGAGRVDDYVTYDPLGAEKLWAVVEDLIPAAMHGLESGLPDKDSERVLRAAVALHWVRRLGTRDLSKDAFLEALEEARKPESIEGILNVAAAMGIPTAGNTVESVRSGLDLIVNLYDEGVLFRLSLDRLFRVALQASQLGRFHLLEAPESTSFIVSDHPVVVHDMDGQHTPDLALFGLLSMAMPVSPRYMIQICRDGQGDTALRRLLMSEEVEAWNRLQVAQARKFVMYHPDSDFQEFVREHAVDSSRHA